MTYRSSMQMTVFLLNSLWTTYEITRHDEFSPYCCASSDYISSTMPLKLPFPTLCTVRYNNWVVTAEKQRNTSRHNSVAMVSSLGVTAEKQRNTSRHNSVAMVSSMGVTAEKQRNTSRHNSVAMVSSMGVTAEKQRNTSRHNSVAMVSSMGCYC